MSDPFPYWPDLPLIDPGEFGRIPGLGPGNLPDLDFPFVPEVEIGDPHALIDALIEVTLPSILGQATVSPPHSCVGTTVTITSNRYPWPVAEGASGPELEYLVFVTPGRPSISVAAANVTIASATELSVEIPARATSGTIEFAFKPGPLKYLGISGRLKRYRRDTNRYDAPFKGGVSTIYGVGPLNPRAHSRCLFPGERIRPTFSYSNLTSFTIEWEFRTLSGGALIESDTIDVLSLTKSEDFEITVPNGQREELVCELTFKGQGPCPGGPLSVTRTALVERADARLPGDPPVPWEESKKVDNYYHNQSQEVSVTYPKGLPGLRHCIRDAESRPTFVGRKPQVGVISTGGSYENITFPSAAPGGGYCIDLWPALMDDKEVAAPTPEDSALRNTRLKKHKAYLKAHADRVNASSIALRKAITTEPSTVLSNRAASKYRDHLGRDLRPTKDRLVYIEAASKIFDVNNILDSLGLALPTMGASGFQSLAGAISTGTHGATLHLPPMADFVRAVHLVGPGGVEWWIEPSTPLLTNLRERLTHHHLHDRRPDLVAEPPEDDPPKLIFNDSATMRVINDDELFESALVTVGSIGCIYAYILETVDAHNMQYHPINALQPWADIRKTLQSDYITPLRNTSDTQKLPWYVQATVGSFQQGIIDIRDFSPGPAGTDSPPEHTDALLATGGAIIGGIIGAALGVVTVAAAIGGVVGSQVTSWIKGDLEDDINEALAQEPQEAAKALGRELRDWFHTLWGLDPFDKVHAELMGTELGDRDGTKSYEVMSATGAGFESWNSFNLENNPTEVALPDVPNSTAHKLQQVTRYFAESYEFCFHDPNDGLLFADGLLARARLVRDAGNEHEALAFQLNFRFTQPSRARLAPQRSDGPVMHIEVYTFPELDANDELPDWIGELSQTHRGRPHWGQKHPDGFRGYSRLYQSIRRFRSVTAKPQMREFETFDHSFMKSTGLLTNP